MNEQKNIQIVKDAYADFSRGDIDGLIGRMTDSIDWQMLGPQELPTSGQRRGKPEVGRFFKQVAETWQFERFEPRQFVAQDDSVVALGSYSGKSKATGKPFASEWAHVFTIRDGKVARFREYTDTANLIGALARSTAKV